MAAEYIFHKLLDNVKKERPFKKGESIILACSGGPDSVALMDILARIRPLLKLDITSAYFNHGLRPGESKREEEYVLRLSKEMGLNFTSGRGDVKAFARKNKISLQEAARNLRYNFLFGAARNAGSHKIVLGHHRDDSIETALLGVLKGAGLRGISGIDAVRERDNILLIRPLLAFSKKSILAYLSKRGLEPCLDSSNLEEKYLRNRLRLKILPILRSEINPKVDDAILRLSEIYSKEDEYLDEIVSKNINKAVKKKGDRLYIDKKSFLKRHIAIERRFLRHIFGRLGIVGEGSNFRQIEFLRDFIAGSRPGQRLDLAGGFTAKAGYGYVCIGREERRGSGRGIPASGIRINIPGVTAIKGLNIKLSAKILKRIPPVKEMKAASPNKVFLDAQNLKLPIYLRTRRPGDLFAPLGMKGRVKLKKYFINAKIPQEERASIPLVVSRGKIVWVVGYAISEDAKVCPLTQNVLMLVFKKNV